MNRAARFAVVLVAALGGAIVPLAACGGASDSGAGGTVEAAGGGGGDGPSTGSASGGGGSSLSDAAVDVLLNNDDPPQPNGTSYCGLCGGSGDAGDCSLGCDLTSGSCFVDGGVTPSGQGCKLVSTDGSDPTATCADAGTAEESAVCNTSADCGAGLACVGKSPGQCRAYCCGDVEACPTKSWCVPERMTETPDQKVPVCVPADECSLLDTSHPCTGDLMCTIVRNDGTTACVKPGSGMQGDGCPCAPGFVCSLLADKCFKLCHIGANAECPVNAQCVGGMSGYPDGVGNCVGGDTYDKH